MINETALADAAAQFRDKPYALGDPGRGWDCLNSLAHFFWKLRIPFPREFRDWNEDNYAERYAKDPRAAMTVLGEFLSTLGREVGPNEFMPGDLMIFRDGDNPPFGCICQQNGNVLVAVGKKGGIRVLPMQTLMAKLIAVRRLSG